MKIISTAFHGIFYVKISSLSFKQQIMQSVIKSSENGIDVFSFFLVILVQFPYLTATIV